MGARLRGVPWWGWTIAAVIVLVSLVAALGGLGETPVSKVPTISLGDVYEGRQVDSRVESIELAAEAPGSVLASEGGQVAIATVLLTNHDDSPVSLSTMQLLLLIEDIDYIEVAQQQVTARDLGFTAVLQPGLPTEVLYLWNVPSSVSTDDAAIIGLLESVPDTDSPYGDGELSEPLAVRRLDVTFDRDAPRAGEAP